VLCFHKAGGKEHGEAVEVVGIDLEVDVEELEVCGEQLKLPRSTTVPSSWIFHLTMRQA